MKLPMKNYQFYQSPLGTLRIAADEKGITGLAFSDMPLTDAIAEQTPLLKKAAAQLDEYFAGARRSFDLPLNPAGTEFQKKVWDALVGIGYGETRTYGRIAATTGNPKACRAVGMANNRNPIAIIIPCHRVVGANGSLTGYAGGLDKKEFLLDLERTNR